MESIYYVINWACHRRCKHCYDDRFRPYVRDAMDDVIAESLAAFPQIIGNLPDDMTFTEPRARNERRIGRIILAGGEVLVDPVREQVFYPILEALQEKYQKDRNPVHVIVQTTGDLVTDDIVDDMLSRGVWLISISGMDDYHVGMEGEKRAPVQAHLRRLFTSKGMEEVALNTFERDWTQESGPFFNFFGAQPGSWIGDLWPRGRAWQNGLSQADMETNFCARQSGAMNFMNHGIAGSEVSIEPNGNVYPCCIKTGLPLGNLTEEPLLDILDSYKGHPVFEALNRGEPHKAGETIGWSEADFLDRSETLDPKGRSYGNFCIGCDKLFEEKLGPIVDEITTKRRAAQNVA